MDANRFFSVSYDIHANLKVRMLMRKEGGYAALGRLIILYSLLYDNGGRLDLTRDLVKETVNEVLDLDDASDFIESCGVCGLVSIDYLERGMRVCCDGVIKELQFKKKQRARSKKAADARWKPKESE